MTNLWSGKHTEAYLSKQKWTDTAEGIQAVTRADITVKGLWDQIETRFKKDHPACFLGTECLLFGNHFYWCEGERLLRRGFESRVLTDEVFDDVISRMIQTLDGKQDHCYISSMELVRESVDFGEYYNISGNGYSIFINGVCYNGGDFCWEIEERFTKAAKRHGYMIDGCDNAFKELGLPYNLGNFYHRKSNLIAMADEMKSSPIFRTEDGKELFQVKEVALPFGEKEKLWSLNLMLFKVFPGTEEVCITTGPMTACWSLVKGRANIGTSWYECTRNEDGKVEWHQAGASISDTDNCAIYVTELSDIDTPPQESQVRVLNTGGDSAIVLLSWTSFAKM